MTTAHNRQRDYPGEARLQAGEHIAALRHRGGSYRAIAIAAGVAPMTVHDIAAGRRTPTPATADALLAVTSKDVPRARVDAGGTRLRLRAMHVMGHGCARIARATGISEKTIRKLVRGDATAIPVSYTHLTLPTTPYV